MGTKDTSKKNQVESVDAETPEETLVVEEVEEVVDEGSIVEDVTSSVSPKRRGRPPGSKNAAKQGVDVAVGTATQVVLEDIDLDDETFKFRVGLRLGNLTESIKEQGQQFPILLRPSPSKEGKYQIISGFRRVAALTKLKWIRVNAIVRIDLEDDVKACQVSVIENEIRQTYNDLDRAYAMLAYREMGKSNVEINDLFKVGDRQRQRLQKLTSFPDSLKDAVANEEIPSTHAVRLMQHVAKYPDADVEAWIERIIEEALSYKALNAALKEAAPNKADREIEFFVKNEKDGKLSLRIRPISINDELTTDQRKKLKTDLEEVLAFLKLLK